VLEVDVHVETGIALAVHISARETRIAIPAVQPVLARLAAGIARIEIEVLAIGMTVSVAVGKVDGIGLPLDLAVDPGCAVVLGAEGGAAIPAGEMEDVGGAVARADVVRSGGVARLHGQATELSTSRRIS